MRYRRRRIMVLILVIAMLGGSLLTIFNIIRSSRTKDQLQDLEAQGDLEKEIEDFDPLEGTSLIDEEGRTIVTNPDHVLVLVNKERYLPADYKPEDLVDPGIRFSFEEDVEKRYFRDLAAPALRELFEASEEEGLELFGVSGFRSYSRQEAIFNRKLENSSLEEAKSLVAEPGQSEHQTGLAIDLSCPEVAYDVVEEFENTKEGIWLRDNAHKYGFIIRYPKGKEEITGYSYEPWHIRYVGKELAEVIYQYDLSLEEVLGFQYKDAKKGA